MSIEPTQGKLSPDERAFIEAATKGDETRVRELLGEGVSVDVRDSETYALGLVWNITALMCAAANGHLEIARLLLQAGANVSTAGDAHKQDGGGGSQALHYAMKSANIKVAEALLDAGADPNAIGGHGRTPLTAAIYEKNFEGVRLLLKRGADLKLKPRRKDYEPPLYAAAVAVNNTSSMVAREGKLVLEAEEVWAKTSEVSKMFNLLLSAGADPNTTDSMNTSPLSRLALGYEMPESLRVPIMEALLAAGARADVPDRDGGTALLLAVLYDNPEIVKLLCRSGAEANRVFQRGTALDIAEGNVARLEKDLGSPTLADRFRKSIEKRLNRARGVVEHVRAVGGKRKSELETLPPGPPAAEPAEEKPVELGAADFLRFINNGEPQWSLLAVKAPVEEVAGTFVKATKARKWKKNVSIKPAEEEFDELASAVAIVSIADNPWTVILRTLFYLDGGGVEQVGGVAKALSEQLKTKATTFFGEDKSSAQGYDLFENGKIIEHAIWDETGGFAEFDSNLRKRPELEEAGEKFADDVFREQGIYLPACYPKAKGRRLWLVVEEASADRVERADLVEL